MRCMRMKAILFIRKNKYKFLHELQYWMKHPKTFRCCSRTPYMYLGQRACHGTFNILHWQNQTLVIFLRSRDDNTTDIVYGEYDFLNLRRLRCAHWGLFVFFYGNDALENESNNWDQWYIYFSRKHMEIFLEQSCIDSLYYLTSASRAHDLDIITIQSLYYIYELYGCCLLYYLL